MEYLTPAQVAGKFKVRVETVWKWIREGKLSALDTGGNYRISDEDIKKFEEANRK